MQCEKYLNWYVMHGLIIVLSFFPDICEVLDICQRNNIRNQDLFEYYGKGKLKLRKNVEFFNRKLQFRCSSYYVNLKLKLYLLNVVSILYVVNS